LPIGGRKHRAQFARGNSRLPGIGPSALLPADPGQRIGNDHAFIALDRCDEPVLPVLPPDSREMAPNGRVSLARHGESSEVGCHCLWPSRERLKPAFIAPTLELVPVTGVGADRVGGLGLGAIGAGSCDLIAQHPRWGRDFGVGCQS